MITSDGAGLSALEARLYDDLSLLELPAKSWVPLHYVEQQPVLDVAILGAGMCGLTAAAALRMIGVDNVLCFDRAPAGQEGPWGTYARMETLRSPKQLTGPALGLPALTFRAWYQAQFGAAAWDALDKIPRTQWMDYLIWYRRVLGLPVINHTEIVALTPYQHKLIAVDTRHRLTGETRRYYARRVVLANGRDGLGGPAVPDLAHRIARRYWAHSAQPIDFSALQGKRVAVVGAGASAMDNAATALEAGAQRVDLFIRRDDIPRVNKFTGISSQGVVQGFVGLSDAWKWQFLATTLSAQTPPPRDSTRRVSRHANAHFHLASPIVDLEEAQQHLVLATPKGRYEVDFVIFATGFDVDVSKRGELHHFAHEMLFWSDVYTPPVGMENRELASAPYLGPAFELQAKTPENSPLISRLHCFNYPSTLTHGKLSGDIPAVSEGAKRLAQGIARHLFVEDCALHYDALTAFDTPELVGDEWHDAEAQ